MNGLVLRERCSRQIHTTLSCDCFFPQQLCRTSRSATLPIGRSVSSQSVFDEVEGELASEQFLQRQVAPTPPLHALVLQLCSFPSFLTAPSLHPSSEFSIIHGWPGRCHLLRNVTGEKAFDVALLRKSGESSRAFGGSHTRVAFSSRKRASSGEQVLPCNTEIAPRRPPSGVHVLGRILAGLQSRSRHDRTPRCDFWFLLRGALPSLTNHVQEDHAQTVFQAVAGLPVALESRHGSEGWFIRLSTVRCLRSCKPG